MDSWRVSSSQIMLCAVIFIWGDFLALRYGRAGWRNQLSRVDGFGIVCPKRDVTYCDDAQHRGIVLLNVALQSCKVRRVGQAQPAPAFVPTYGSCRWPNRP